MVSTYSLVVKFPTPQGAGILRGDQATARSCYVTSLRNNVVAEALNVKEIDPKGENEGVSPVEELTQLVVNIGSLLEPGLQAELARFLRQNQGVFV